MEVDVAVLGGGPGGYTAAIRAAQLGAKVACIEKEPELGGTCLRVGCIPTKAWVQTAHFLHQGNDTFAKLGVKVDGATLDFGDGTSQDLGNLSGGSATVSHTYNGPSGSSPVAYTAVARATDVNGETASASANVNVTPRGEQARRLNELPPHRPQPKWARSRA